MSRCCIRQERGGGGKWKGAFIKDYMAGYIYTARGCMEAKKPFCADCYNPEGHMSESEILTCGHYMGVKMGNIHSQTCGERSIVGVCCIK